MTTNDPDTNTPEDDEAMQAAPIIDPADVGETPVRAETPAVESDQSHEAVIAPKPDLLAKLAKMIGAPEGYGRTPRNPAADEHPVPTDDRRVRASQIKRDAWLASLAACDVTALGEHRVGDLKADQNSSMLTSFASRITNPPARNLVLAGRVGAGKSSAAVALGWAAIDAGLSARFLEHSKYLLWLRPDQSPTTGPYAGITPHQLRARARACDLLVVDDLAASLDPKQPVTQFVKDETLTLIGDRIDTPGKITVVTTNRKPEDLEAMFGEQFTSRLSKHGRALKFLGDDHRGRLKW